MRSRLLLNATLACAALVAAPVVSLPTAAAAPRPVEPEVAVVDLPAAEGATTELEVPEGAAVLGVTWDGGADEAPPSVQVRALRNGEWSSWTTVDASDDAPDPGTEEAERAAAEGGVQATDPVDVLGAEKVEVRTSDVTGVDNLAAAIVDPGESPADVSAVGSEGPLATADAAAAMPSVVTRSQWGADESLRGCTPSAAPSLSGVIVHHTADRNTYTQAQAPAIMRSIYAYHTQVRKWCDVGYNALVDKFGTIYEGRYGGLERNIIGAHSGGFNSGTWGVSVIGNYEEVDLPTAARASLEKLTAWRLGVAGIDPSGTMRLISAGSPKYASGVAVTLPVIAAHRDVGLTSCPGRYTYDKLSTIRGNVDQLVGAIPTATTPSAPGRHAVVSGDTLSKIAARYGTTVAAVQTLNGLSSTLIRVGQVLRIPPSEFVDVAVGHPLYDEIRWLADQGITLGVGDGTVFGARSPVERQHMAAFLYRLAGSPAYTPPPTAQFHDVPRDHTFYREISWLASKGITRGVGDGRFGAKDAVQRQQMAGFLLRLSGEKYTAPSKQRFADVPKSLSLYAAVSWLASTGITEGVSATHFGPLAPVQRQHMAAFLYRYSQG